MLQRTYDGSKVLTSLPRYYFVNNFLLFDTASPQIDSSGFDTLMSHKVCKEGDVVKLFEEVFSETVSEGMWVNYGRIQIIFDGIVFELLRYTASCDPFSESVKK